MSTSASAHSLPLSHQTIVAEHEIRNISCAAQDPDDLCTFAYITKDLKSGHHFCHVFSTVEVVSDFLFFCQFILTTFPGILFANWCMMSLRIFTKQSLGYYVSVISTNLALNVFEISFDVNI